MSCHKNKAPTTHPVVRASAVLAAALYALLASSTVFAVDSGDIVLVSLKGEVFVTMSGVKRAVSAGSVLEPPATLRTGRDGAVELRQGATTLSVGPETLLEFPALERRGAPIDRIVQPRGNVFYNIGKRAGRKLRIETPYLVGVVKGTQFNVAAQQDTTTISLFEGLLEVRAADESGVVDLRAGEIASRQRDDKGVSVLKMDGARSPAILPRQPAGSGSNDSTPKAAPPRSAPRHQDQDPVLVDVSAAAVNMNAGVADPGDSRVAVPTALETVAAASLIEAVDVPHAVPVDTIMATVGAGDLASVAAPSVDASVAIAVDLPAAPTDIGTGVLTIDTGVAANIDPGSGLTVLNGSSSHLVEVTVGSENAADAVAGNNHGHDVSSENHGPSVEVSVDSGSGLTVINGSSSPLVEVTVGSENAADAVAGNNHGHDVSSENHGPRVDVSLDLDVDLGLDDDSPNSPDTDNSDRGKPGKGRPADVDLFDSLVRHRGKK